MLTRLFSESRFPVTACNPVRLGFGLAGDICSDGQKPACADGSGITCQWFLLTAIGLYWAMTAGTYLCGGSEIACQSSYEAWLVEKRFGLASPLAGLDLL